MEAASQSSLAAKAELELQEARYTRLGVLLLACEADTEVLRAQGAAKDV